MIHAVIMAGGSGTRFWPLSRETLSKQFLAVCGRKSLIQQAFDRIEPLVTAQRIHIVANPAMGEKCLARIPDLSGENLILEPMARNTAPAIGIAALALIENDPDALMVVLAADHHIPDREAFLKIVKAGCEAAKAGYLVTLGLIPVRPETGYGYIKKSDQQIPLPCGHAAYVVDSFKEKPDPATAQRYIRQGGYYWNSGIFIWKAALILREIESHMPDLHCKLSEMNRLPRTGYQKKRENIFRTIAAEAIDTGVMEKSQRTAVIPADFPWYDVGSLSALADINPKDESGNVVRGNFRGIDNKNSIFYAGDDRLVAALGLNNMIVVDTADATLVCPMDRAQNVKKIAEALKKEKNRHFMEHEMDIRPWGVVVNLSEDSSCRISKVEMAPAGKMETHCHDSRDAHWIVLSGTALFTKEGEQLEIVASGSLFVPRGTTLSLENKGDNKLIALRILIGVGGEGSGRQARPVQRAH